VNWNKLQSTSQSTLSSLRKAKIFTITWEDSTGHQITRLANLPKQVKVNKGILVTMIGLLPNATEIPTDPVNSQDKKKASKFYLPERITSRCAFRNMAQCSDIIQPL
jgi:hypothetical protein